jgi:hypothetical protein
LNITSNYPSLESLTELVGRYPLLRKMDNESREEQVALAIRKFEAKNTGSLMQGSLILFDGKYREK